MTTMNIKDYMAHPDHQVKEGVTFLGGERVTVVGAQTSLDTVEELRMQGYWVTVLHAPRRHWEEMITLWDIMRQRRTEQGQPMFWNVQVLRTEEDAWGTFYTVAEITPPDVLHTLALEPFKDWYQVQFAPDHALLFARKAAPFGVAPVVLVNFLLGVNAAIQEYNSHLGHLYRIGRELERVVYLHVWKPGLYEPWANKRALIERIMVLAEQAGTDEAEILKDGPVRIEFRFSWMPEGLRRDGREEEDDGKDETDR